MWETADLFTDVQKYPWENRCVGVICPSPKPTRSLPPSPTMAFSSSSCIAFVAASFIFLLCLHRRTLLDTLQPRESISATESTEPISTTESIKFIRAKVTFYVACLNLHSLCSTAQLPSSIREWRCPNPGLDEAGNDAGDAFWRALYPVLRDAGFVLWKHEGSFFQYVKAGGDPLVNGFGYLIPYRAHATAIGGGVANLRMFQYLASVILR